MSLSFGVFELDPSVPELRERGRPVHLQDVPIRVLTMLLARPGELVTREELFAEIWPHDDSGILDDNLNTAVRKLRLALNDSAHHPRFIETVPKRGYRFVAPVTRVEESGVSERASSPAPPVPTRTAALARLAVPIAIASSIAVALAIRARVDTPEPDVAPSSDELKTLAVLPFSNASGDPDNEYFSDGLTEEIMDRLARSKELRVVSRTSAFAVQTAGLDAREIGRRLGTDALVEGSVRRDGDRLRITVRLVDSRDGYQLWSESYDRRMDDIFAVQQDIAVSIARTLSDQLLAPAEAEALALGATDPVAYDHYLQGRFYWHRRTEEGLRSAVQHLQTALQHAPDYARAWTGLADAYAVLGFYDYLPPTEAFPRAKEAASRALELDPGDADAEATLGYAALYYDWNLEVAEAHFQKSIELRPHFSKAHQWYANLLTAAGRFDEAEREMRRAQQLDPLSLIASAALGWSRYYAGHYEEALEQLRLTKELDADFELVYLWSGWAHEARGEYRMALEMLQEAVNRSGGSGISTASLARARALSGESEGAERLLEDLIRAGGYVPAYEIAKAYFALERPEEAMRWLERAYDQRSHSLVFLRVDPQLADVQRYPPFEQLAERIRPRSHPSTN